MHKFLSLFISGALLCSPLSAAANTAGVQEYFKEQEKERLQRFDSGLARLTPAVFERFQMLVSLFLGDEQPAASSGSNASLTAQEKQALADIIKEIFEDWQQLHQDENYRQEADKAWLLLTAVLLQQPNWSDFFDGERNFRENYFASLADFYLETVKTNLVTSSTPSNQAQEQASLFGLALQNLISFQLSGYAIPKKVWEELAPRAVQSLQSAMVVESVFPILMKNGSWGALEQSMAAVQQKEWDARSGRVWGNVMKALEGAGIVGSLAFAKERLYNFDPRQDLFYGALSSFASPYWKKAPFSYSPSVFYEYYILSLPQRPPHRAASNLSVVLKKSAVAGRETIACRSGSVSMTGTEVYIYPESLAGGGSISPSKMQPIEKTPYAARKVEILERISKGQFSAYTKQAVLPELVVGGGGASMTGKAQQGMLSTNAWTEFARQLARQHPSLLKKYTVNLFDNDGEPKDENKIIWPLVYGYLQSADKKGEKETKIALYMARKTWGDLPYVQEQNMDFVLTYYYPELACYSYKNSGEADGERSYIMTTAENVQAGRGAQMAVRLNDTVQPLASTIDWTLLVVSAPALLKGGWRLAAGSGRLIVGRPLLQGVRVSRRQYLLYSQAQLKGIVESVGRTVKQVKKAVTVPEIPAGAPRIPSAARPVAPNTAAVGADPVAVNYIHGMESDYQKLQSFLRYNTGDNAIGEIDKLLGKLRDMPAVNYTPQQKTWLNEVKRQLQEAKTDLTTHRKSYANLADVPSSERGISSVSSEYLDEELLGNLNKKIRDQGNAVAFNDRSLMPSVRRGTKASDTPREDGLVYLEQHIPTRWVPPLHPGRCPGPNMTV